MDGWGRKTRYVTLPHHAASLCGHQNRLMCGGRRLLLRSTAVVFFRRSQLIFCNVGANNVAMLIGPFISPRPYKNLLSCPTLYKSNLIGHVSLH